MNLDHYVATDARLGHVSNLARELYTRAGAHLHNYDHALWDTERIITIAENEGHARIALPIAAGLMHDTGVSRGAYKDHAQNGGIIIREQLPLIGFSPEETEGIATAVEQHNLWEHTTETARYLFDGDTLNKAGKHGIYQCLMAGREFGLDMQGMASRFLPYLERLVHKGYYTGTARNIDHAMGYAGRAGLETTLAFWQHADRIMRTGDISEEEIIKKAMMALGEYHEP